MRPPQKMIIYNLFPLLAGRFPAWGKHFLRASEMGFNWIFVNPIQGPGLSGSLYAIRDYNSFNPLFIDDGLNKKPQEQAKDIVAAAEKLGLKMMIDLVVNHCAVDADLVKTHPEWFVWEKKGQVAHPFAMNNGKKVVWGDLAKFDHRNTRDKEGLFQFFFQVVRFLLELGFRGFRCDAAYQVPQSFWRKLIEQTKSIHSDALFFAETLGCPPDQTRETARAGFDYIFNSAKWWDFKSHWLMEQYHLTREISPSVSFPESHDTERLCEELQGKIEGLKQRYLFTALFSAGLMMPIGYEFGFRKKLHVVQTRPEDWELTKIDLNSFVKKVNRIKATHPIFQEEVPTGIFPASNPHVLVMWKGSTQTSEEALLILNKDLYSKQSFYSDNLHEWVQAGAPLVDVSPEDPLDYISAPFSYDLLPGQGIVLVTGRT